MCTNLSGFTHYTHYTCPSNLIWIREHVHVYHRLYTEIEIPTSDYEDEPGDPFTNSINLTDMCKFKWSHAYNQFEWWFMYIVQIGCCYGAYVVEVTLHSYSNPSGRCDQCQDGSEPGCCDEPFIRPAGQACPSNSTCDPFI